MSRLKPEAVSGAALLSICSFLPVRGNVRQRPEVGFFILLDSMVGSMDLIRSISVTEATLSRAVAQYAKGWGVRENKQTERNRTEQEA